MKIINKNNKSWYSIIISLLLIWILLVLSTWILNMVLTEMKDNKAMWDYIKAYAWAESAQELALLKIKKYWYAYYDKIDHNINNRSILLSNNPTDLSKFKKARDVFISYDIWSKTNEYNGTLQPLWYDIIPLFYINDSWEQKVNSIVITKSFWEENNLVWNIIWYNSGISWKWLNTLWVKKTFQSNQLKYSQEHINDFISHSNSNYLVLFNAWNSELIKYKIVSWNTSEYFSKPRTSIISSAEIGKYKQNLETILDNTKYLNRQKYVIYSN
jgi:hypothetical protein